MVHNSILSQNIVVELKILGLRSPTPPFGHPSLRGIRGGFPSTEGCQIQICRGGFFFSPRPSGTPPLRGIRGKFPSTRGVTNSDLSG